MRKHPDEDKPVCPKCNSRKEVLKDICGKCSWHILKDRAASTEELEDNIDVVDGAIADLQIALGIDVTRET